MAPWEGAAFEATGPTMAQAAAKLPAPAEGTDVEVLLKEGRYTELAPHQWRASSRTVFRIITRAGVRAWSEARVEWSPWRQQRPLLRARVISPDGKVHPLDEQTLHDAPVEDPGPDIYTDTRALRAPLPALRPGSLVEVESIVEDTQSFFEAGVVTHFYFASPVPVRKVRLDLDVALTTQLTLRVQGLPLDPLPQHQSDRKRLSFEGGPYAPVAPLEADMPPAQAFYPHVAFSTGRSWNDVAASYHRIVEGRLEGASLQPRARELSKGTKDRRVIAQRMLEHVRQSVRYTGLEFGAAAIVPARPQEVLTRQYGDCKEMSTLLVGLLRGAGIPAHVALVRVGREDVPQLPGMGFFNHAIVYVPGSPDLWMDPTDPGAEAGVVAPELQGRHALVATPDTQGLVRIDETLPERNTAIFTRTVTLSEEGPARVHELREFTGALAVQYRRLLKELRPMDFRRNMEAVATAQYQGTLEGMKHSPLDEVSGPFRMELDIASARFAATSWRSVQVPLRIESPLAWLPDTLDDVRDLLPDELGRVRPPPARRQADLVLPVAYRAEARYRLKPPRGFAVNAVPRDETLALGPASLSLRYMREQDGGLSATYVFDSGKRRYTPDEVNAFRTALADLVRREAQAVEFEDRGSRLVEGARVRDGLAVYERWLTARPDSALVRARYAGTLLRLGFGGQAREEARRAVTQRPDSPLAHHVLAWVLQHDLHGRLRHPGADFEGAVAACRKAISLEPENVAANILLADMLEHNAHGERFGQGARLTEAITTWRHLRDTLRARNVDDRLMTALFRAGASTEALEAARVAAPSELRGRVMVMTTAELKGAADALALAEREFEGLDSRREALTLAGDHLLTKGHADAAARLFEAALKDTYDPDLQFRLELARKSRRGPEKAKDAGAIALVRSVVLAAWTAHDERAFEEAIRPHLSSRDRSDSEFRRKLRALHAYASRHAKSFWNVTDAKFRAELAVSALDLKPDGQEKVGYRVRLNLLLGDQTFEDAWYVVRENKEYKLLASASDPRPLGAEALRWLDAGHLKEAIQWIRWAVADTRDIPPEGLSPLASFVSTLKGFSGMEGVTHLRAASAYLGANTGDARVLKTLRSQASFASGVERHRLMMALAVALKAAGKGPDAEALLDEVREDVPASEDAFNMKREFLVERGRWRSLRDAADRRLGLLHTDPLGMETLLVAAVNEQHWDDVGRTGKQLVDQGAASAEAYRTLAWAALLRGRVTADDVQWAQRAVRMSRVDELETLSLLATLLVETGKLEEARKLMDSALAQHTPAELTPGMLYARARLAEAFGLPDAAQALYRAMPGPNDSDARSFQKLAKSRMNRGRSTKTATARD
ncbi:DUF3857 domain-containing protein [Myxococcus sp. AB036A]|uniref:DUF3857 domain-containing protein n=1 Tax=Myxococcus sp. AB036A TaxID=2562793 RepID=UPI00189136DA|nr:DUF3857 domain-containing protein [Myxococcus sp. AB036A]